MARSGRGVDAVSGLIPALGDPAVGVFRSTCGFAGGTTIHAMPAATRASEDGQDEEQVRSATVLLFDGSGIAPRFAI
jgi:hypothetical protein